MAKKERDEFAVTHADLEAAKIMGSLPAEGTLEVGDDGGPVPLTDAEFDAMKVDLQRDQIVQLAVEYQTIKPQVDALYARGDEIRIEIQRRLEQLGKAAVCMPSGEMVTILDNYATTNVVFRPAAVRRFELSIKAPAREKKGK